MLSSEQSNKSAHLTITKLTSQKRPGYYNVFIDDKFVCGISDADLVRLGLHNGQAMMPSDIESLKALSQLSKNYGVGLTYLSYRIRSQKEVEDHLLRKGIEQSEIDIVISQLKRDHYINDSDFANRWLTMRINQQKSKRAIQVELMKKGISREVIDLAFANCDETDNQSASLITQKKRAAGVSDEKIRGLLARRGFSYSVIKAALEAANFKD